MGFVLPADVKLIQMKYFVKIVVLNYIITFTTLLLILDGKTCGKKVKNCWHFIFNTDCSDSFSGLHGNGSTIFDL
jgi:hypothetical protein